MSSSQGTDAGGNKVLADVGWALRALNRPGFMA